MPIVLRSVLYFKEDLHYVVLLFIAIGGMVVFNLLSAWPIAILVDTVLAPTPQSQWMHEVFLAPFGDDKVHQVLGIAVIHTFIKIFQAASWGGHEILRYRLKFNGTARVRRELFDKFEALSLGWHRSHSQGDSLYRLNLDTLGPWGILDTLTGSASALVTLVTMVGVLLARNVSLTLFALSVTPLVILSNLYFTKAIRHYASVSKRVDAEVTTFGQRVLYAIGLIQAYGREVTESVRFKILLDRSVDASMRVGWREGLFPFTIQSFFGLGEGVIIGYGGYLVYLTLFGSEHGDTITIGDLIVFMTYLKQFWDPLSWVFGFTAKIQTYVASCERVFEVLDEEPAIQDLPNAQDLPTARRVLTLSKVTFGYHPEHPVLREVSVRVQPGEMVAFLGRSGTGKSTLLSLLPRFYDPQEGQIALDDTNIKDIKLRDLRRHMALVTQDSPIFPGTVEENIRFGGINASDEAVRQAAEQSGAAEFIEMLPQRYQSELSEGGQNLSGGQRQRLAIARALLSSAPILIFDEPTSALDHEHEVNVMATLERLRGERTILIVTHRLNAVRTCDRIYVMRGGRIVEEGQHEELLSNNGPYMSLLRDPEVG